MAGAAPVPKKQKLADPASEDPASLISPQLLSAETRAALRSAYQAAEPYLHGVFQELLPPAKLAQVREEIVGNIQATYKETDLFKVFQTGNGLWLAGWLAGEALV
jgi:hypothetical protein